MTLANVITANEILNRAAAEVGVEPVGDPLSSPDSTFVKMRYLLNTAGEELAIAHPWEFLVKNHQILTADTDTGEYALPSDFNYMINQTGWERNENVPLGGPLSAQEWTYLKGRNLASSTLYASFRIAEGKYHIYPEPPPVGQDLNFEYITNLWVADGQATPTFKTSVEVGTDRPLFDKTLITRYLKLKWLESSGFDTTKAQTDFNQVFSFLTGFDKGAEILNAGGGRGFPYLSMRNVPDTGYGGAA
jgi:hypothetical protein